MPLPPQKVDRESFIELGGESLNKKRQIPFHPLSQAFKISMILAVVGMIFVFTSILGGHWIAISIKFQGRTFTAIRSSLWTYCIELPHHMVSVTPNECYGLTVFTAGTDSMNKTKEGLFPQVSVVCSVVGLLCAFAAMLPLFKASRGVPLQHYWGGGFLLMAALYNLLTVYTTMYGTGKHLVHLHLNQANHVEVHHMWGVPIYVLGSSLIFVAAVQILLLVSVFQRRGRNSIGSSIFSTSSKHYSIRDHKWSVKGDAVNNDHDVTARSSKGAVGSEI